MSDQREVACVSFQVIRSNRGCAGVLNECSISSEKNIDCVGLMLAGSVSLTPAQH